MASATASTVIPLIDSKSIQTALAHRPKELRRDLEQAPAPQLTPSRALAPPQPDGKFFTPSMRGSAGAAPSLPLSDPPRLARRPSDAGLAPPRCSADGLELVSQVRRQQRELQRPQSITVQDGTACAGTNTVALRTAGHADDS
jgi:hypothetical protein